MSEPSERKGSCLCGAIRVHAKQVDKNVGVCHCNMCRQWSGGPFFAIDCGTEVSFEGQENMGVYVSSQWAERGFCKKCGSSLFYRIKANQQHIMPVGLFASDKDLVFDHQIFIDEKPAYYDFANETENMTGAEVFAKFAPPTE